jgi:hypothetical protein
MKVSTNIVVAEQTIRGVSEKLSFVFDDPPGYSSARIVLPMRNREAITAELREALAQTATEVDVMGRISKARSDETWAVLVFVLAGFAGGVLGAVGQDAWKALKDVLGRAVRMHESKRNLVEVILIFSDIDVILHFESRNPNDLPKRTADADGLLAELQAALKQYPDVFDECRAVELRISGKEERYRCIRYGYPRGQRVREAFSDKNPAESQKSDKDSPDAR